MTAPVAPTYLARLQSAEREQGLLALRTLLAQHGTALARLPRLADELRAWLDTPSEVDHAALAERMQAAMVQAQALLLAVDMAPIDHPEQPDLAALGERLCGLAHTGNLHALLGKLTQAAQQAQTTARAAQAQQAEQAKASAKAEAAVQASKQQRVAAQALGYTDHGDGTVTDTKTRLMWKQCAEGQSLPDCRGQPMKYSWDVAMKIPTTLNLRGGFAGHSDWRLPTKDELTSLVFHGRTSPAICTEAFPNAPSAAFWSSSPSGEDLAWGVDFVDGFVYGNLRSLALAVRLVRASQ